MPRDLVVRRQNFSFKKQFFLAAAYWRMRRAWAIENRLMEKALRNQPPGDEAGRIAAAFSELAASPELNLLHRYETRLHPIYQRALFNLAILRKCELPNEKRWPGNLATPGNENARLAQVSATEVSCVETGEGGRLR